MTKIVLIAPNREIAQSAAAAKEAYRLDVEICHGAMEAAPGIVAALRGQGAKVVISRGGTALLIKQQARIPVVEIKMSLGDAVRAIEVARQYGSRIMFVGFLNHVQDLDSLGPLLGLDIGQTIIRDRQDAEAQIKAAKAGGYDVIIGGAVQCEIAEKLAMPAVFLQVGLQSVYNAYNEAKALLEVVLEEERKTEEIRALLDNTGEGFVAIDRAGRITLVNQAAVRLLGCAREDLIGELVSAALPGLANLNGVLMEHGSGKDEVITIGKRVLLYNKIPLRHNGETIGAMATLKDAKRLSEEEGKIRVKQHLSGLYAKYQFSDIIGASKVLAEAKRIAESYARVHSTVLITSESGTGKEMFTQSIHNASPRSEGPFVAVNCAALAPGILESELFGYAEGAFSGAKKGGKMGVFELAHGGTIFLDEVGEVSSVLQEKLLRVLQERCVMRLGDDKVIPVDVRVVAATNKDLVREVKEGRFREDLFFRLNVLRLAIPPLRERKEDILALAQAFLTKHAVDRPLAVSPSVEALLQHYDWPGNIRELENLMERLSIISERGEIRERDLHAYFSEMEGLRAGKADEVKLDADEVTRVLALVKGNKTKAAVMLGVHRSTLWRFLNDKNGD